MKTQKLIELQRKRLSLHDEARAIFAQIEAADPAAAEFRDLEARHDAAMRAIDQVNLDIDEEELRAGSPDATREAREARRPGGQIVVSATDEGGSSFDLADRSGWVDERGSAVRVLGRADRFAETSGEGIALGDALRAMVTGARTDFERRAMSTGVDSAGGYTVPAELSRQFIDRMRARSVVNQAGARTVPMSSSTLAIAKLTGDPAVAWRAENGAVAESDPTFGRVQFEAKSLSCIVKVSRELFADTVNAGAMIEQALVAAAALELDRAAIYGDGTNDSPTGVINTAGINEVSMGTNGAALTGYNPLLDAIYELELDNVERVTAGIMHPRTGLALAKLVDGNGNPLVEPRMSADVPRLKTTAAPINETQGTATNCSSVVYGDYRHLLIGMREDIGIRLLSEVFAGHGQIAMLLHMRADIQLSWASAFTRLKGIKPA